MPLEDWSGRRDQQPMPFAGDELGDHADHRLPGSQSELAAEPALIAGACVSAAVYGAVDAGNTIRRHALGDQDASYLFGDRHDTPVAGVFQPSQQGGFGIVHPAGQNRGDAGNGGYRRTPCIGAAAAVDMQDIRLQAPDQPQGRLQDARIQFSAEASRMDGCMRGEGLSDGAAAVADQRVGDPLMRQPPDQIENLQSAAVKMAAGFKMENMHERRPWVEAVDGRLRKLRPP